MYADGIHGIWLKRQSRTPAVTTTEAAFDRRSAPLGEGFGNRIVNEGYAETTRSDGKSTGQQAEPRTPRSIRFSDSEWAGTEKEAKTRGMTAAELVRHAAVSFAAGKLAPDAASFAHELAARSSASTAASTCLPRSTATN